MALNEAKEKVQQLENAIRKLDAIKKHLSHSASDIKVEIHSCVSHNLECLRGREVSLLSKVDELVTLKEDALQQQQAKLNQALGVLQTRMAMMTSDSVLDKQLAEVLTAFNEIDLSPGETPHIAFRADHMSLRECILNYGRVDSNALPLPSAFDDPGKPSASLPRHLEEYEDEDHHIFYKTVEELKQNDSTSKRITVTIPKLSTRIEDWLQKRQTPQEKTMPSLVRPKALPNQASTDMKMSYCPTPGGTCSLNNWLSQIKSHADLEEEHNFEIVDNSHSKKVESASTRGKFEDLKPWLHKSSDNLESLYTAQKQSQNLFQHIPSDSKFWLYQSCGEELIQDGAKQKDLFHHISKEPSTWLRTRAYGKQTPQCFNRESIIEKFGTSKEENMNQWLAPTSKETQVVAQNGNNNNCCRLIVGQLTSATTGQEKKSVPFQLEDICKANELCSTLIDCVCKPNCAVQREQELSGVKNPLDPTKVFNPPQLPLSQWLISSADSSESFEKMDFSQNEEAEEADGEKKGPKDPLGKGMFSHIPEMNNDQWLFKPVGHSSEIISSSPTFKHCKEEANLWLQQTHDFSSLESNAKVILNFNPSNKSLSEWLMSPAKLEVPSKDEDNDMMKEDSEGWSLCSSPATFSSEQFSKDVKVATSYMQDWVL